MLHFLTIGTVLGLSAGFAPGPLLTLILSETLRHNIGAGIKVAAAPFITDLPIILFTMFILSRLTEAKLILAAISFCGACYIFKMGVDTISTTGMEVETGTVSSPSFRKGIVTNMLSPHPYLFWLSVGIPIMFKASQVSLLMVAAFLLSFYFCLVGSKVLLAVLVGKSKSVLTGRFYIYSMRILGVVLCALACLLFYDGLELLKSVIHSG